MSDADIAARETVVRSMLDADRNLSEIAQAIGISKQAVWQFCARRGWLTAAANAKAEEIAARRREARRMRRLARSSDPAAVAELKARTAERARLEAEAAAEAERAAKQRAAEARARARAAAAEAQRAERALART